jgi:hypothetical protein
MPGLERFPCQHKARQVVSDALQKLYRPYFRVVDRSPVGAQVAEEQDPESAAQTI